MNQKELVHPKPEKLAAFGVGKLSPEEIADIENHLAECDSCCKALETVQDDTFISLVRTAESETVNDPEAEPQQPASSPMEAATLPPSASATPYAPNGTAVREADETLVEQTLADHARYRVLELLGTGGMGAVYKAEHRLMGRTVALKVITPHLVDNQSAVERFQREVQAAARLSHPNIVTAHDAEQAGDAHFLVMEYVEGTSLADEIDRQGRLPVAQACDYVRQAAVGLQHASECDMVHRDIKPHNLMLTSEGRLKILDFGLAQFASQTTTHGGLTQEGSIMGTPDYMAPEQARDARTADIRADIYSLGCTLYCLLAGQPPFPEGSLVEKVMAHTEQEPPPLDEFRDDVPTGLRDVLNRMMAKDPAARYQTPAEAAEALKPFAEGETKLAAAAGSDRSGVRRWMWPLTAAAAALLVLFATIIYIVTDKGTFEIKSHVDDVQVVLSKGGEDFIIIDLRNQSKVRRLPSGEYEISLRGNSDLKSDKTGFTMTRGDEVIVTVIRKPTAESVAGSERDGASQPKPGPWVDIFDGRSTAGWEIDGPATWNVENDVLVARGRQGHGRLLYTRETFDDLDVRVECKVNASGNSGVFVRTNFGGQTGNGYEAQITNVERQRTWTGGIYGRPFKRRLVKDDAWFVLEIRAWDNVISVKVNGEQTSQFTDFQRQFRSGLIGLQAWGETTVVSFRRVQIRRLDKMASTGGPTGNLVANSGFEDATDTEGKQAAYWIALAKTMATEPEAQCYRDTNTKFKGEATAVIVKPETKFPMAEAGFLQNIRQLPAGQKLVLSGSIKTKDLDGAAYIRLNVVDPSKGPMPVRLCSTTPVLGTADWQRYDATIDVPAGCAGELAVVIRGKGTAWFDEISLQVAPELPTSRGLANGGFEDLAGQMPKDWMPVGLGMEGLAFKADRTVKHDGAASATIISTRDDQQPYNWRQELADNVPVGKTVKLAGWVKTKEAAWAGVGVQLLDANAQMVAFHSTQHQQDFTGTADWKQFTLRFPVPNGTAKIAVLAMVQGRGQAWFDDFALAEDRAAKEAVGAKVKPAKKPSEAEKAALEAAHAWLGLMDKEEYAKGWEECAGFAKALTTKEEVAELYKGFRKPLGKVLSRKLRSIQSTTSLPGAPDGEYVLIQFETSFENKKEATEVITPMLDKDGKWRVSGYFIK